MDDRLIFNIQYKMDEFSFIEKYLAQLTFGNKEALFLKDDAAIFSPQAGYDFVITKDALVEGTHFFKNDDPYLLAKKLLRVNISDLAAKGATPYCCFLALILPKNTSEEWLKGFASGLRDDLSEFGCFLAGGDTTSHEGALALSLTIIGLVPSGKAILRSGAKNGDSVYVTGTIGDSYLGLVSASVNSTNASTSTTSRYYLPQPRPNIGKLLSDIASACIDVSDGLLADLSHICECSEVGAEISINKVPFSEDVTNSIKTDSEFAIKAITGGDDYELLFTAPAGIEEKIAEISNQASAPITKIGVIKIGSAVVVLDKHGNEIVIDKLGYKHPIGNKND